MQTPNRFWGITVASLGVGILLAFFLPETVLVLLEALIIVTAGCLFLRS